LIHRHWLFIFAAAACATLACMGSSSANISRNTIEMGDTWLRRIKRLLPRTNRQWGIISVAMAFLLLAIGAAVSLFKPRRQIED
jgi:hypothetical protein